MGRLPNTVWLAGLATAFGLVAAVSAAPFQNGSFEDSIPGCTELRAVGQPIGTGWVVSRGSVYWYNGNAPSPCLTWHAANGAGSLDLVGSGAIGGVSQTFDSQPGAIYRLTFAIAGNPSASPASTKPYDVYVDGVKLVGGSFDVTGRTATDMGWQVVTQYFTASSATTTLEFVADNTPYTSAGAALDDVQVTMVSTPAGDFQNGSFELGTPQTQCAQTLPPGSTALLGWTVVAGEVRRVGPCGWQQGSGDYSVELGSSASTIGAIEQTFATVPTNRYRVTFKLAGNPAATGSPAIKPLTISVDGVTLTSQSFNTTGRTTDAMGWVPIAWSFVASSTSTTVRFTGDLGVGSTPGASVVVDTIQVVGEGLLINRSFDLGTPPTCDVNGYLNDITAPSTAIPGWAVSVGSVDWVGPCVFTSNYTNSYMLDLIGSGKIGGIRQSFAPVPGRRYGVFSALAGNPTGDPLKPIRIDVDGASSPSMYTFNATGRTPTSMGWLGWLVYFTPPDSTATVEVVSDMTASATSGAGAVVDLVAVWPVPPPIELTNVTATTVSGRIDDPRYWGYGGGGAAGAAVRLSRQTPCGGGGSMPATFETIPLETDAHGHFTVTPSAAVMAPGSFLWVQLWDQLYSTTWTCVYLGADNEVWPRAVSVDGTPSTQDYLDTPGKARWYKFSVLPGQQVKVSLHGLPADYDLAVFKDIRQTFSRLLIPQTTTDLTKLSAEYAPSMFSPSMFSPSVFSPAVFSPDAYAPSMFSPDMFSPSMFSPSMFSPSVVSPSMFSPSMFSPSMFSPSMFSPSMFSPSMFSPSMFSPSMFSPDEISQAFSSAQTRSLLGVSATSGRGNEVIAVNTWNEVGEFYVRVWGRGGASSIAAPFTLTVDKGQSTCTAVTDLAISTRAAQPAAGVRTVFVTDSSQVDLDEALLSGGTLRQRLTTFLARSELGGVLLDVSGDARVRALKVQAAANAACPFAMNLVAQEIKGMIDAYRANNPLRYVVLGGNDGVIPFFRYPDESLLGQESGYSPPVASTSTSEASLRRDFVLGQDAYGSSRSVAVRTTDLPVPDLAVGRLVETPAEMAGLIDAYVQANGRVVPQTSLVTGYDFLADVAAAVKADLEAGTARAANALIAPATRSPQDQDAWTAGELKQALLTQRHDLIFLAGHFSANSALAADFATSLVTLDVAASPVNLTNALVFSAGCHSGYNIVDGHAIEDLTLKLDWAQVMTQKRATLVAGTGYQYGDTDFIEYSERLYQGFARQLRYGTGPIAVGEALARAKVDYLVSTPDLRGLHQKAVLQATVFGLPMLGIDLPAGRIPQPPVGPGVTPSAVTSGPAAVLGLRTQTIRVAPAVTSQTMALTNVMPGGPSVIARWLSGPDGVVSNPAVPALPLAKVNVTSSDASVVLRGVGFRGGHYTDLAGIVPLTGAATADLRGVHVPFGSPTFFPMRLATANYFGALAGSGGTMLLVTPAQYRADDVLAGTSVERRFDQLDFKLYYSGIPLSPDNRSVALSDAPTIVRVDARTDSSGGPVTFVAQVVGDPAATIHEVWLTYAPAGVAASGANWSSIDLQQCVPDGAGRLPAGCSGEADSSLWTAHLATPVDIQYIVQAASGTGVVALDDNLGRFYRVNGSTPPATTTATFNTSPPTSANFGETPSVSLSLKAGTAPLANQLVTVSIGGNASVGITGASGNVTVGVPVVTIPGSYELKVHFAGDATHAPTVVSTPFVVGKAPTAIGPVANGVTLTADLGGKTQPLIQETVIFEVSGSNGVNTVHAATDYLGRALLPPPGLPPGTYTVSNARFAGNATYHAASLPMSATFTLAKAAQAIDFAPLPTVPVGAPDFLVSATTSSGLPVSFAVTGNCALIGLSTVHVTGAGSCTVTARQAGDAYYDAAAPVSRSFVIGTGALSVSAVVTPASFIFGDDRPGGLTVSYQYGLAGDSACMPSPLPTGFTGPASPLPAGAHEIAPPPLTLPAGCIATYKTSTLTVAQAEAAFAGIAPVITVPSNQAFSVAGLLNRPDVPNVYPRGSDATSFEVILNRSATQSQSLTPSAPAAPNGSFTVGGPALPIGSYGLEFLYDGGPNFKAATDVVSTLRVEGFAGTAVRMTQARSDHTATLLNDGRVLVVAGKDGRGSPSATAEVYCPAGLSLPANPAQAKAMCPAGLGAFGAMPRLQGKSVGHTATLTTGGKVLIVGGGNASTEIFDPVTNRFTQAGGAGGSRAFHTATLLPSGLVLLVGGADQFGNTLATTQLYDPRTSVYSPGPTLLWPRERHSATLVGVGANAKVIIAGGRQKQASGYSVLANVEIYDVSNGTLAAAAPMAEARYSHQADVLADGRVLVSGGSASTSSTPAGALASAELYGDGRWASVLPPMHDARREYTLTRLVDGRFLITGGGSPNGALASSETFTADLFTLGAPLTVPRYAHSATRLGNGSVLVTGGMGSTGTALDSAEIFNTPP